jgi:hypothetical protein
MPTQSRHSAAQVLQLTLRRLAPSLFIAAILVLGAMSLVTSETLWTSESLAVSFPLN